MMYIIDNIILILKANLLCFYWYIIIIPNVTTTNTNANDYNQHINKNKNINKNNINIKDINTTICMNYLRNINHNNTTAMNSRHLSIDGHENISNINNKQNDNKTSLLEHNYNNIFNNKFFNKNYDNSENFISSDHKNVRISNDSSSSNSVRRFDHFIDLTRKTEIYFNGIMVDENSLLDVLKEHEKELIFGKTRKKRAIKLVHLNYGTNVAYLPLEETSSIVSKRTKRSVTWSATTSSSTLKSTISSQRLKGVQERPEISIHFTDNEHKVNIRLQQAHQLIDDAFVFIKRSANTSQLLEDSRQLVIKLEKCFYHNDKSALDLCDKYQMRGVFHHNNTNFIIHPLPSRFGNSTHIILEAHNEQYDNWWPNTTCHLNDNIQFEPDMEQSLDDKYSNSRHKKYIKSNRHYINLSRRNKNCQSHSYMSLNVRYKPRYYRHHRHLSKKSHDERVRKRRHITELRIPDVLHIETAVFVDSDLYKHMAKNFPKNTANHLIRFVLAMINGVQLLYHHGSLGRRVNYVLKRLELLEKDPIDLRRSSDIDVYLSNFCKWQNSWNPPKDSDPFHYDHAVILTGLDLYVVDKNGKVISQVVGLAPVAGMCIPTSSCTINEGKHFESVFVVAHEIGHNLGMRHDAAEISCDPSLHIMSPTLGSGKTSWSKCSRDYLNAFLEKPQAKCLFDHGKYTPNLDHAADGLLPGERFDADLQCMLKYGKDSVRARTQMESDICRDLHCQRDRYTWTSHPALEGTLCGDNMWCRNGQCIAKQIDNYTKNTLGLTKPFYNKFNFTPNIKLQSSTYDSQKSISSWSEWSEASQCDSGCLYGPSKRLGEGSTGLITYTRNCLDYKRRCLGRDRKYESCTAKQCYKVPIITIENFAHRVCERAQKFDYELTGEGEQIVGNIEESCKIYCKTKTNGTKSRRRLYPDGTACRSKFYGQDDPSYCIQGRCEKFSCDNSTGNYYKIDANHCIKQQSRENASKQEQEAESAKHINTYNNHIPTTIYKYKEHEPDKNKYPKINIQHHYDNNRDKSDSGIYGPTTIRSKYENEVALRPQYNHNTAKNNNNNYNNDNNNSNNDQSKIHKYTYHSNDEYKSKENLPPIKIRLSSNNNEWLVKSGCYSSCMAKSKGAQVVMNKKTGEKNIQLCTTIIKPCDRLQSTAEFADNTCSRYKQKVRGLSGRGTQIAASIENPDRSCRVGCQDEYIKHRFYLVNGKHGHFPLGTKCSTNEERYCVNGKCLEFGTNNIPLQQSHISLALFRNRRSLLRRGHRRKKRSFLYFEPVNITEFLTQDFINGIVNSLTTKEKPIKDESLSDDQIEFAEPIYYCMDELVDK